MIESAAARRQIVGAALRRYREMNGYEQVDAAKMLACDRSKISRIEFGERGIMATELRLLLCEYGVSEDEQTVLAALVFTAGRPSRLAAPVADAYRDHFMLEGIAAEIRKYEPLQVPDLLQTPGYAAALGDDDCRADTAEAKDLLVRIKLVWQQIILTDQPRLDVVIGEAALRQRVGGDAVMQDQLAKLAYLCEHGERVAIRVLPFALGAHAESGNGPLTILQFTRSAHVGAVHLHGFPGTYLVDQEDVAFHLRAFTMARAAALSQRQSADLIRQIADTLP